MKVICINDKWRADLGCENYPRPSFGDIDTVVDTVWKVIHYYELDRFKDIIYACDNFCIISDLDETEMERDYVKLEEKV